MKQKYVKVNKIIGKTIQIQVGAMGLIDEENDTVTFPSDMVIDLPVGFLPVLKFSQFCSWNVIKGHYEIVEQDVPMPNGQIPLADLEYLIDAVAGGWVSKLTAQKILQKMYDGPVTDPKLLMITTF